MKNIFILISCLFIQAGVFAQCFEPDASIWKDTWASCSKKLNPIVEYGETHWIMYDLGSTRRLSKTWVWNTNDPSELDRGFNKVKIDYSLDGIAWTNWGEMNFPQGKGDAVYGGFFGPDMVGLEARYVLITALSNYGDPTCAGLAEVKFNLLPQRPGELADGNYDNCGVVSDIQVDIIEGNTAVISWNPYEEIGKYLIDYREEGTQEWTTLYEDVNMVSITELDTSKTYEYRVKTLCFTTIDSSSISTFKIGNQGGNTFCPRLNEIILEEIEAYSAFLYWPIEADGRLFAVNLVQQGTKDTLFLDTDESEIFLDDLIPNTTYEVIVSYECGGTDISSASFNFTTLKQQCARITEISLDNISMDAATLSWEGPGGNVEYIVAYKIDDSDYWNVIETVEDNVDLKNLMPSVPYVFSVGFKCGEDVIWSDEFFFFTESQITNTQEIDLAQRGMELFPNPTRNNVTVAYYSNQNEEIQYSLISTMGQLLQMGTFEHFKGKQQFQLDLSSLPDGVYFLNIHKNRMKIIDGQRIVKISP